MGLLGTLENKTTREKISQPNAVQAIAAGVTPPVQSPLPCISCRGPFFWMDHYGQLRCLDCLPPPSRSLVRLPLWGIAGSSGSYWWETLEDPPLVFRPGWQSDSNLADDGAPPEPQVVAWEFPGPGGRLIYSVAGRSRVDRETLHWGLMARLWKLKGD